MRFIRSALHFLPKQTWLAIVLCLVPILIYWNVFIEISLNVNYVAYDDIAILGVIPGFEEASWLERWHRLTDPLPEHRLIFSRLIVLVSYYLFGQVNLVGLMLGGNLCLTGCAVVFYAVFRRLRLSIWYFVPVLWLWFTLHFFENTFWGMSSLYNFGVLLFTMLSFYYATHSQKYWVALLFALIATFSFGNGIITFVVIAFLYWVTGRKKEFFITLGTLAVVGFIYFSGFPQKTASLDFSDSQQVLEGIAGFFGFIGSIVALEAYSLDPVYLTSAVVMGVVMIALFLMLFRTKTVTLFLSLTGRPISLSPAGQFTLVILLFVAITSFAVLYKRIPLEGFESLFKGRYRMYTALGWVALHFGALAWLPATRRRAWGSSLIVSAISINLLLLYVNFGAAVNNRRVAIAQEFNSRYNSDWLGLDMFNMSQQYFESIRSYYQSEDPLAEGWNPRVVSDSLPCDEKYVLDSVFCSNDEIRVYAMSDFISTEQSYTDGAYVLLKSDSHVYASPPNQSVVPMRTLFRRFIYFARGFHASFHKATVVPGTYKIYVLIRRGGKNTLYCTDQTWVETD
jgi:hypothetical protein